MKDIVILTVDYIQRKVLSPVNVDILWKKLDQMPSTNTQW
jgi:hypothetical protein